MTPYEMATFDDGDVTLSYEVYGSGDRLLVYIHGILLDTHVNQRLARGLAEAGHRVVLLDLPGHGNSGKPLHASAHRMDAYAAHVVHLLDHLGAERAVVGGLSLGADVTLQVALLAPERLQGMVLEMPVLEQATPVAALIFVPWLAATQYAAPVLRGLASLIRHLPRERLGLFDQVLGAALLEPEETAAVLHGVLVGPVAPTVEQRHAMEIPALVIGHRADRLHPFGDAHHLAEQLPQGRLVEARSLLELRMRPERLTAEIAGFLDEVWATPSRRRQPA
ncbi:MAG TPA: alpha/beta fold hydrolase [Acidimicrobiales bacterium]|nr:alpha/beta fold hydrolase [Acidimicrobiales bacterium]